MNIVQWILIGILVVASGVLLADYAKRMKAEKEANSSASGSAATNGEPAKD